VRATGVDAAAVTVGRPHLDGALERVRTCDLIARNQIDSPRLAHTRLPQPGHQQTIVVADRAVPDPRRGGFAAAAMLAFFFRRTSGNQRTTAGEAARWGERLPDGFAAGVDIGRATAPTIALAKSDRSGVA
jgi:hypothetical protein